MHILMHKHTKTCTKYGGTNCRFKYPKFPCKETIISVPAKVIYEDPDVERDKLKKATQLLQKVKDVLEDKDKMAKICEYKKELISHCMVVKNIRQRLQHLLDYVTELKMQDDGKSVCIENKYFDEINDLKKFISDHGRESYDIVRQVFPEFNLI